LVVTKISAAFAEFTDPTAMREALASARTLDARNPVLGFPVIRTFLSLVSREQDNSDAHDMGIPDSSE